MALELYQEIIPFTNEKMPYPVSTGNSYSNPVVMPLSFDVTSVYNTVESVIYIRNNDKDKYYRNVLITFMAPKEEFDDGNVSTVTYNIGSVTCTSANELIIKDDITDLRHIVDIEFTSEIPPESNFSFNLGTWFDGTSNAMLPVSGADPYIISPLNSSISDVRFSYGYDEVSELEWANKKHGIVIPWIGTSGMPDNSFIPIRLRIWLNSESLFTLKKYAINVSYDAEIAIA